MSARNKSMPKMLLLHQTTPLLLLLLPLLLPPFAAALAGCTAKGLVATGSGFDGRDNYTLFGCIEVYKADEQYPR